MLEGMAKYEKDFKGWAKVAEEVEGREREEIYKSGVVYWANLGVGVGSNEDGKGERFTRPVLLLAMVSKARALIVPITSQVKEGVNYREILVAGKVEYLLFDQVRTIDTKCLEGMLDDVGEVFLRKMRGDFLKVLKYHFYK